MNGQRSAEAFEPQPVCWICGGAALGPADRLTFDLSEYRKQDPALAAYSHERLILNRCGACGFAQPEALPTLARYFERMYDQRWSPEWMQAEFEATTKDLIFARILEQLRSRVEPPRRRLLDIGAHVGRFIDLARAAGWLAEGLELNPQTAAYARQRTGARVRQLRVEDLEGEMASWDAITLTDVLEHIPRPMSVLSRACSLLAPGGWIAVKVPCGPAQRSKEAWRARLRRGYRPTIADNLVHVSHFSPRSLVLALEQAGFRDVSLEPAAPEIPPGGGLRTALDRWLRRGVFAVVRAVPAGVHSPLALNLQVYARRP